MTDPVPHHRSAAHLRAIEAEWVRQALMPPMVLRARATRTDDPIIKQRLLDLAKNVPRGTKVLS